MKYGKIFIKTFNETDHITEYSCNDENITLTDVQPVENYPNVYALVFQYEDNYTFPNDLKFTIGIAGDK